MALPSITTKVQYAGNNSTTLFPVTFVFYENASLRVILKVDATGVETVQTITTDYTLTGGDGAVGDLTMVTAPATGETLTIKSNLDDIQETVLPLGGKFPSTAVETQFDKNVRLIQQQAEETARSFSLNESSSLSGLVFPDPGAGNYIRWNTAGTQLEAVSAVNDSGNFLQSGAGAISRTVTSKLGDIVSVKDFGATGDGSTDDTAAIQAAIDSLTLGGMVFFPIGIYVVSSTITVDTSLIQLVGTGDSSIIRINHNSDVIQLNKASVTKIFSLGVSNLNFDCTTDRTAGATIHVGNVGQCRFENIRITAGSGGRPWNGIVIDSGSQCFYHHVRINSCANTGLTLGLPNATSNVMIVDQWFTDCQFDTNLAGGIVIANNSTTLSVEGLYFTRCSVFGNTGNGVLIDASGQTSGAVMSANYFFGEMILDSNTVNGLLVQGTSTDLFQLRLFNVWCSFNTGHGIFLPAMVKKFEINGGFVLLNGNSGVTVKGDNGLVTGLSIYDNNGSNTGQYGIDCDGTFITISNNRLYNTAEGAFDQNGLFIQSSAVDVEVINNYLDTEGASTVYTDSGTQTRAYNNILDNTLAYSTNHAPLTIGNGNAIVKYITATAALDFDSTLTNLSNDKTITLTGALVGESVILGVPNAAVNANTCYTAWVSATNTVTVRFNNYSAGTVNPTSATFRVSVLQH